MANLSDFAVLIRKANEDKLKKELLEKDRKIKEVAPLLSGLFNKISTAKSDIPAKKIVSPKASPLLTDFKEVLENPNSIKENKKKIDEKIISLVTELEHKITDTNDKLDDVAKKDTALPILEKKMTTMFNRLQSDMQVLKRHIDSKPTGTTVINNTGGGGEVKILRMDDVDKSNIQDGATLVWDAGAGKFKMIVPTTQPTVPLGLEGGLENQVLVKNSGQDYDYGWQDMIVNTPVYTKLIDRISPELIYIGESVPGSTVCEPKWRIKKITQVGIDINIIWANGDSNFDKIWDSRESYTFNVDCGVVPPVVSAPYNSGAYNSGPYNGGTVSPTGTYNSNAPYNSGTYN